MTQQLSDSNDRIPMTWQASIPLLSSSLIIKQLFAVFFVSSSCVLVFLLVLELVDGQLTLASAGKYLLVLSIILIGL